MADATYSNDADVTDTTSWTAASGVVNVVGGVFNDSIATIGSGNAGAARVTNNRALHVNLRDATGAEVHGTAAALADAESNPTLGAIQGFPMVFNGTTWDRLYSIQAVTAGANTDRGIVAAGVGPGYNRQIADQTTTTTGALTAVSMAGGSVCYVYISGGSGLSYTIEGTAGGGVWKSVQGTINGAPAYTSWSTGTVPMTVVFATAGLRQARMNVSAITSGTVTISWTIGAGGPPPLIYSTQILSDGTIPSFGSATSSGLTWNEAPNVINANYIYNGSNWDQQRGAVTLADALTNPGTGLAQGQSFPMLYNGTTWDRARGSSNAGWALVAPVSTATGVDGGSNTSLAKFQSNTAGTATPLIANTVYNGSTWDLMRTIQSLDAAPNTDVGVTAVGIGPGWDRKQNPANLGTAANSAITIVGDGADTVTFAIGTSTTGTYAIEQSADDSTWVTANAYKENFGGYVAAGGLTPTSGDVYIVEMTGYRQVRLRTVTTLGATMAVKWTSQLGETFPIAGGIGVSSTPGTVTTGTAVTTWFDQRGRQIVGLSDSGGNQPLINPPSDGDNIQTNNRLYTNASLAVYRDSTHSDIARAIASLDAAPNVDTGVLAVGKGPGWDRKQNPANLATATNSVITVVTDGADLVTFAIGTTTTGTIIFETTPDDSTWSTAGNCIQLSNGAGISDTWVTAAVTPTASTVFIVRTTGMRQVRVRTASTLGATVAVKWTGSAGVGMLKTIDIGPAPHSFGITQKTGTVQLTASSTGTDVLTVTAGKVLVITSYQIQTGGTTAGAVQLYFGTSTYARGTNRAIFDGEFAPSSTSKPGVVQTGLWQAAAVSTQLRIASAAAINPLTVTVWGYEY